MPIFITAGSESDSELKNATLLRGLSLRKSSRPHQREKDNVASGRRDGECRQGARDERSFPPGLHGKFSIHFDRRTEQRSLSRISAKVAHRIREFDVEISARINFSSPSVDDFRFEVLSAARKLPWVIQIRARVYIYIYMFRAQYTR